MTDALVRQKPTLSNNFTAIGVDRKVQQSKWILTLIQRIVLNILLDC